MLQGCSSYRVAMGIHMILFPIALEIDRLLLSRPIFPGNYKVSLRVCAWEIPKIRVCYADVAVEDYAWVTAFV